MYTPIKYYDKVFEIYDTDKEIKKHTESAKEKLKNFLNIKERWNDEPITLHLTSCAMGYNFEIGLSNQSTISRGTSTRGTKYKTTMYDILESEMKRMSQGIQALAEIMKDGNHFYERSIDIAKKQAITTKEQVHVDKEQQSKPRIYSENDMWTEIENVGVMSKLHKKCLPLFMQ
ncbi:hypothetical protein Ahy_A10g048960 [Arachis hypogaea]|uniref:Uncharacterized protein n=1 Tax=Arachis hypogaea TaxID=3818 RepID=A0A445B6B7_ARAHY|nr:hypothetical protein Ahy_A10g048960 [Arachis hypogaea]